MGHDYDEFAQRVRGLVKHEVNVEVPLSKFAVALDEYSKAMKKMVRMMEHTHVRR